MAPEASGYSSNEQELAQTKLKPSWLTHLFWGQLWNQSDRQVSFSVSSGAVSQQGTPVAMTARGTKRCSSSERQGICSNRCPGIRLKEKLVF